MAKNENRERKPRRRGLHVARGDFSCSASQNHRAFICCTSFPNRACSVQALGTEPFILLDKAGDHETSEALARCGVTPDVRFTTWDDYAIMAMVECGLGVSLLPELILRRVPYRIAIRRLDTPLYRDIALVLPGRAHISAATRQFLRYLDRRNAPEAPAGCTGFDNQA